MLFGINNQCLIMNFSWRKNFKNFFLQSDHVIKSFNYAYKKKQCLMNTVKPKAVGPGADDNANNHANNTSSS